MVRIEEFVGVLLGAIAKGRAISDQASVRVAEHYLNHELLKGFPVPRMQISDLEVNVNFALAATARECLLLEDEEVQKSIRYRMRDLLGSLPGHPDFKAYFRNDSSLEAKWKGGLGDLDRRLEQVLRSHHTDFPALIHKLSVSAHNYFYEHAPDDLGLNVSSLLASPVKGRKDNKSMRLLIEDHVRETIMLRREGGEEVSPGAPAELNILLGAEELEKLNPSLLNRLKITVSPADRRWISSERDGHKVHILGT
jgi:hypothetical protein